MAQGWNSISHPLVPASALNTQRSRFSCSGEFIRGVQKQLILWGPKGQAAFCCLPFWSFSGTNVVKAGSVAPTAPRNSLVETGDVMGAVTESEQTLPGCKTYDPTACDLQGSEPLGACYCVSWLFAALESWHLDPRRGHSQSLKALPTQHPPPPQPAT